MTRERINQRNQAIGAKSRWEKMPLIGKKKRIKAIKHSQPPKHAVKHDHPFAITTGNMGLLSLDLKAKSARDSLQINKGSMHMTGKLMKHSGSALNFTKPDKQFFSARNFPLKDKARK